MTVVAGLTMAACVSTHEEGAPADALHIGTVLPFSGARAASGAALESAMRLAIAEVNDAGGLAGRKLWLDVEDSHSDDARGIANASALIGSKAVPYFVGTEEPKVAYQLAGAVKAHNVVHLMPGLTSPRFHDPSSAAAWFRLSPSGAYIACALAKHIVNSGIRTASVLVDPDDYSADFANMFGVLFSSRGGTVMPTLQLDPQAASYGDTIATVEKLGPGAVALVTSPTVAAGFLQEWAVRGKPLHIFLGPTLNSLELLRNVPSGVLEGMIGISADLGEQSQSFRDYFEVQTGVPDIAGAHYYFDAVALLALSLADGIAQTGTLPLPATMKARMVNVTAAGGSVVTFDQLAQGLALLAAGGRVEYQGAAGSYILNTAGDSTQNSGALWQIAGTEFVTVGYEQCTAAELQQGGRSLTDVY
jgi:ABC-type branched-subunit amino acid transport system substrate-binding protein